MGRPKDTRKEAAQFRMNEREENAFVQYFNGWKTNREVSKEYSKGKITSISVKNINSAIGRYSKRFLALKWVNNEKRWFTYPYARGEKQFQGRQKVPYYKANIQPFIDYFFQTTDNYRISFLSRKAISTLYLFFELKDVRRCILSSYPSKYYEKFGLYEAFCATLDRLIDPWLRIEGRLPYLSGFKDVTALLMKIPEFNTAQNAVQDYFQSNTPDYDRTDERERIIALFNLAWQKFVKRKEFKILLGKAKRSILDVASEEEMMRLFGYFPSIELLIDLLRGFPSAEGKEWLLRNTSSVEERISSDIKIRSFAGMLYSKDVSEAIIKSFLEPLAQNLIFSR